MRVLSKEGPHPSGNHRQGGPPPMMTPHWDKELSLALRQARAGGIIARTVARTLRDEIRAGDLLETIRLSRKAKTLVYPHEPSYGELLEIRATENPSRGYLLFEDQRVSVGQMNERANAVASGLQALGVKPGETASLICPNCPEFLYAFFALQKLGMGCVPVNTALVGDGLAYIINNSISRYVIVHASILPQVLAVREKLPEVKQIIVIAEGTAPEAAKEFPQLASFLGKYTGAPNPGIQPDPDSVSMLMYTSGTTGLPKGVVYRFRDSNTRKMRILGNLFSEKGDIAYSCLPLFHANALLLSTIYALNMRSQLAIGRRFSASRFWEEVSKYGVTTFNTLGAMIPILLKQPPGPFDRNHKVRVVISAACPADCWEAFEKRYGVKIIEAYGAVDGGGFMTLNLGNAPVGSIGKPMPGSRYRLVTEEGEEIHDGRTGELHIWAGESGEKRVEYYRNGEATTKKNQNGWIRTGDLLYRDKRGFLYFAGRNTDSMRRRGENVSAYEVESVIDKHPDVLECAVYAVPSELGEDDIMAAVVPIEGRSIEPAQLWAFLQDELARYAIPRYIEITDTLPKTGTHRVQKNILQERGVTEATWDAERKSSTGAAATKARRAGSTGTGRRAHGI